MSEDEAPRPGQFDPAYERYRHDLMQWLDRDETYEVSLLVPTAEGFKKHTLRRRKAAMIHSGHRYWWWTAVDEAGRCIAGRWHLSV